MFVSNQRRERRSTALLQSDETWLMTNNDSTEQFCGLCHGVPCHPTLSSTASNLVVEIAYTPAGPTNSIEGGLEAMAAHE